MRAGKGSSDAYLADWKRSEPQPVSARPAGEAAAEAAADSRPATAMRTWSD